MKRLTCLILIFALIVLCAGCAALLPDSATDSSAPEVTPELTPEPTPEPTPEVTPEPAEPWEELFSAFLKDNYEGLNQVFSGTIAGIGFIDLDIDGSPELLIFDAGASASMGVQFFDIFDGQVVCVSANILEVGRIYGMGHLSSIYVNTNFFDDFRLMRAEDGERFFCVVSGNGADDFNYTELVCFENNGQTLRTVSRLYHYETYSSDSDSAVSSVYEAGGEDITAEEYQARWDEIFAAEDLGYNAAGVFIWERSGMYASDYDGFVDMVDAAVAAYVPVPEE